MSPTFGNPANKPTTLEDDKTANNNTMTSRLLLPLMRFFNAPTKGTQQVPNQQPRASTAAKAVAAAASVTALGAQFAYFWEQAGLINKRNHNHHQSQKSNDTVYAKLLVRLTQEFGDDLLGLFAYGSRIYGNAGPHSDVDVDVLIKSRRRCRRNIVIDGLEVEMFIHPPSQVLHNITSDTTGIILRCYAFGRIIYDPNSILPALQRIAKMRWDQGPTELEPKDTWRVRYEIADLLRDLEDIDYQQNETTAHFLLVKLVERLVRIQERICHRWPEKLKRCFENWETWDSYGGHLGKRALSSSVKWEDRLCCARDLANHVLEPIGGIMPTEWKMDWEDIANEPPIIPKIEVFISS